jgi:hypothetical protein
MIQLPPITGVDPGTITLSLEIWRALITRKFEEVEDSIPAPSAPVTDTNTQIFAIWAEENSTLGNNTWEWAYGNGANTRAGSGIVMGLDATCFALGLSLGGAANATVELEVNGVLTGDQIVLTSAQNGVNTSISTNVSVGDVINFKTISASGTAAPCQVVAWFRAS